jgi:hypothetical protein
MRRQWYTTTSLHGTRMPKAIILIHTTVKTSNPTGIFNSVAVHEVVNLSFLVILMTSILKQ